jgi:hypothetical protein
VAAPIRLDQAELLEGSENEIKAMHFNGYAAKLALAQTDTVSIWDMVQNKVIFSCILCNLQINASIVKPDAISA